MNHPNWYVRSPIHSLGRIRERAGRFLGHGDIVPDGPMSLPGAPRDSHL
jgi:hypothetical protein